MKLDRCYRLADRVAIRTERFGGLIYNYKNRRLYFLKSQSLAEFVADLTGERPLADALDAFGRSRSLSREAEEALRGSVEALEKMGIVVPAVQ